MLKSVNSFSDPLGQRGFGRFTKECLSCLVQVVFVNVNTERHEKNIKIIKSLRDILVYIFSRLIRHPFLKY